MSRELVLTTEQILNLCEFAGIGIDLEKSCFNDEGEEYQLETEYRIHRDGEKAVAWLEEYPEEGGYDLNGKPGL